MPASERKRHRKVWSCSECRRRKLQCDRAQPVCSRCASFGARCTYNDDVYQSRLQGQPYQAASSGTTASVQSKSDSGRLEQRMTSLETRLSNHIHTTSQSGIAQSIVSAGRPVREPSSIKHREVINLRGGSWKNEFYGFTCASSIIAHIPGLLAFAREAFDQSPVVNNIRCGLQALETKAVSSPTSFRTLTDQGLQALLPSQEEADRLVQVYFDNFDCIYHIIHRPHFENAYTRLWKDDQPVDVHFLILVLLIMAIAMCLSSTAPATLLATSKLPCEEAATLIHSCETWLQARIQLYDKLLDFQIGFVLLLAKQLNGRRFKRTWANSARLISIFMHSGLHRDPDLLGEDTSLLEKEMRKRLWTAAVEFELQAAFEQGMAAAPWLQQSDFCPPKNIDDLAIDSGIETERSFFTASYYLSRTSQSTSLRHEVNAFLNNVKKGVDFYEFKTLTEELDFHLETIPGRNDGHSHVGESLLRLNILQFILALHVKQAEEAKSKVETRYSHTTIVGTAMKIVDIHKTLLDHGSHALEILCSHLTRAALSICYVYCVDPESVLSKALRPQMCQYMTQAVSMIKQKAMRYGGDQRHLWVTIAAKSFMELQTDSSRRMQYMRNSVEEFASIFYVSSTGRAQLVPTNPDIDQGDDHGHGTTEGSIQRSCDFNNTSTQPETVNDPFLSLDDIDSWILNGGVSNDWAVNDWDITI